MALLYGAMAARGRRTSVCGAGRYGPAVAASDPASRDSARAAPLADGTLVAFVATTDLDRAHAFYGGVLSLERTEASSFANAYAVHGGSLRVTRVDSMTPAPYTVLGWRVDDLDAAMARLSARGVTFHRFAGLEQDARGVWTAPGGTHVAWFTDPDGNRLSVSQAPPETASR
jgi:predicted enzyme related to lactoylglutathione lyase